MGDWLVEVHDWLRAELGELRAELDTGGPRQLRTRCLGFCAALTRHHSGEDAGVFPMLAKQFPALAPALTKLGEDHAVVARLQDDIRRLLDEESDPALLRTEFDRLAAELDSHFAYEENAVVTALNALAPAPG
jgi:iron-sulfur cluster repair protein YtfE (RIC family)